MRIHYLQHVPYEDPAYLLDRLKRGGYTLSKTLLYDGEPLPASPDFDLLIIMGGPMNIYEENRYPWLKEEKSFIYTVIRDGKRVLGICLGAQLAADAIGGSVIPGDSKEIGWYPVTLSGTAGSSPLFKNFPDTFFAFHWHGDSIRLPEGCAPAAASAACPVQAFAYENRVVGLQFHLESTGESIENLIKNCPDELAPGKFIQQPAEIRAGSVYIPRTHELMDSILDELCRI